MNISLDVNSIKPLSQTIPAVSAELSLKDYLGTIGVRWGIGRDRYSVVPGLYKVGNPNADSDVFVSANYKLSFDTLRKNLGGLNAWILVIDTKGINVWCAAGKGTFGTDNIIRSVKNVSLDQIVTHRRIIVPQLGAPGVAAHMVMERSGFKVVYGPIRAKDIKSFIGNKYKASPEMRRIDFPLKERAKLIPVDFVYGKYKLLGFLAALFILSGLDSSGLSFSRMLSSSPYPLVNIAGAYVAGIVIAPILLPVAPFRAFALKGAFWGLLFTVLLNLVFPVTPLESVAMGLLNISVASFLTMNFTGSSTYTSLSGVKKEMNWAIPFQVAFLVAGLTLFVVYKLQ